MDNSHLQKNSANKIKISENRMKHILGVARLMYELAPKLGLDAQSMFVLGYLHDIGYEFGEHKNHNNLGADLLAKQHYQYANEVRYHGLVNSNYQSVELDLLNFCDMSIDSNGQAVTFAERLADVKSRYGKDSRVSAQCSRLIESLENNPNLKKLF